MKIIQSEKTSQNLSDTLLDRKINELSKTLGGMTSKKYAYFHIFRYNCLFQVISRRHQKILKNGKYKFYYGKNPFTIIVLTWDYGQGNDKLLVGIYGKEKEQADYNFEVVSLTGCTKDDIALDCYENELVIWGPYYDQIDGLCCRSNQLIFVVNTESET